MSLATQLTAACHAMFPELSCGHRCAEKLKTNWRGSRGSSRPVRRLRRRASAERSNFPPAVRSCVCNFDRAVLAGGDALRCGSPGAVHPSAEHQGERRCSSPALERQAGRDARCSTSAPRPRAFCAPCFVKGANPALEGLSRQLDLDGGGSGV